MLGKCILVVSLSAVFCEAASYENNLRLEKYDYVIVGAGSAGSVVANQLSQSGKYTVLLLEVGGVPPPISEIPLFTPELHNEEMEWTDYMEPQENACQEQPGGRCSWSRAKVLGGCSTHNYMCWVHGNPRDYENWERIGAKGWNSQSVLEAMKKVENHTDDNINTNGFHGRDGYQTVSPVKYRTAMGKSYLEAAKEMGHLILDDYNGASQQGFGYIQLSQREGRRCSTEKAFLQPAANRINLDILIHAFVLKINFDSQKRVKSVRFSHDNLTKEVEVGKEVILSAGVLASPMILMHSGIGPKDHLDEMKIPVIVDLPAVGQNLQDHVASGLEYFVNELDGIARDRDVNPRTIGQFLKGEGPLTSPGFIEVIGFLSTKYQNSSEGWPDIMIFMGPGVAVPVVSADLSYNDTAAMFLMLLRPKSRGYMKLRSSDPHDSPIVDPRYLSDEEDVKRLIDGMKKIMSLYSANALKKYNPKLIFEVVPGCEEYTNNTSDEYIECVIRKHLIGGYHLGGTCRMGDPNNDTTVVDPLLRVKGVSGLRIADASIMPTLPGGNLNAPCIMIGQKAADFILSESK